MWLINDSSAGGNDNRKNNRVPVLDPALEVSKTVLMKNRIQYIICAVLSHIETKLGVIRVKREKGVHIMISFTK